MQVLGTKKKLRYHLERAVLYFPLSIVGGGLMGTLFAGVSFSLGDDSSFEFGAGFGMPMGVFFGGVFALLSYWPLRNEPLVMTFFVLALFSILSGSIFLALAILITGPEGGPIAAWFGCMLGYWAGVCGVGLKFKQRSTDKEEISR